MMLYIKGTSIRIYIASKHIDCKRYATNIDVTTVQIDNPGVQFLSG